MGLFTAEELANIAAANAGEKAWKAAIDSGKSGAEASAAQSAAYNSTPTGYTSNNVSGSTSGAYTGQAQQIGNTTGVSSQDLNNAYNNYANTVRSNNPGQNEVNTFTDNKGNVYNTSGMTEQQIFALSLAKNNQTNAYEILKGMGLDANGNPTTYYNQGVYGKGPNPTSTSTTTAQNNGNVYNGSGGSSTTQTTAGGGGGGYTQQPSSGTVTYNVNDPNFLNKSAEERLAIFAQDPELAKQEIIRAKQAWDAAAGDAARQAQISSWADQVRDKAHLPANGAEGDPILNTGGAGNGLPTGGTGQGQGQKPSGDIQDIIGNAIKQTIQGLTGGNPAGQKAASDAQQTNIYNAKMNQYNQLINSLKTGQSNDLNALKDAVASGEQKIDNDSFLKWLEARQGIASRGLAGSGLASDANTRVMLNKQNSLGDFYNTKNKELADINKGYADKLASAQNEIAALNLPQMQADAFNKLMADGQSTMTAQLKNFLDFYSDMTKTNQTGDIERAKLALEKYKADQNTGYLYDKMSADQQLDAAKLQLDWEKYGLDLTKVMGVDANGNPTLDAQKMVAEIQQKAQAMAIQQNHNAAMESQGWAKINQSNNEFALKLQKAEQETAQYADKMKSDAAKNQAGSIQAIMTQTGQQLNSLRTALSNDKLEAGTRAQLNQEYNAAAAKMEAAQKALGDLYKFDTGNTANFSSGISDPFDYSNANEGDLGSYG